jgi:hypothetical protein
MQGKGAKYNLWYSLSCQSTIAFNIGSVENFERHLEEVQKEMGIDSSQWVPVTYSMEFEWMLVKKFCLLFSAM